jgi:hypothetical protein
MKFLFLIYHDEAVLDAIPEREMQTLVDSALDYDEEIRQSGHYIVSNALQRARTARTIRVRGGKVAITDGPFAETKEAVGGFYVVDDYSALRTSVNDTATATLFPVRDTILYVPTLQFGMAGWSFGSIIQRRKAGKAHPVIAGGVQQIAAGLAMIPVALVSGNLTVHWSTRGVSAIVYLITFGSLVGYSAFVYAMDKLPVAIVSVYPYVNAVVAVALVRGSLINGAFGGSLSQRRSEGDARRRRLRARCHEDYFGSDA